MAGKKSFEQYGRGLADSSLTSLESSWENLRQLSKDFESDQNSSNCVLNHSAANVLTNRLAGTHLESTGRKRKKPIKRDLITSFQQYANHSNDGEQEQMNFQIYSDSSDDDQDQRKKSNKRLNNNSRLRNEKDDVVIQRLIQNVSAKAKRALTNRSNVLISTNRPNITNTLKKFAFSTPAVKVPIKLDFSFENSFENAFANDSAKHCVKKMMSNETLMTGNNENSNTNQIDDVGSLPDACSSQPKAMLRKKIFASNLMHSTPKVDPVTKKRRLQTKQAEQLGSPSRTGPSQYVTQVPSPDKDEELKPRFANDSRCLLNLSKKLEKEFKRFDKLKNQNPGVPEDVNTSKANDSTRKVKNHFCSQLVRFSKETLCDRNTWLHSLNSRSKNKREEKPRKRLPIRLLNMQPAQFGFVTCNFEIDYSRTDDVEYIDLRRPRIVFPANLANEMGLTDQMVVEIFEPWQVITCEQTQCNYFLNPFWVRVVHRNQPDEINPPSPIDYLNESGANDSLKVQTAKDCISSHRPTYGLRPSDSFETIYAHPDWVV